MQFVLYTAIVHRYLRPTAIKLSGQGTLQMQLITSAPSSRLRLVPKKFSCDVCGHRCDEDERGDCDMHPSVCGDCMCPCFEQNLENLEVELMQFPGVFDLLIFQTTIMGETRICITVPQFQGVDLGDGKMRLEMASSLPDQLRERITSSELSPATRDALLGGISQAMDAQPTYLCSITLTKEELTIIGLDELADAPWGELMKPSERTIQ
jgi:hypothetical protein